MSKTAPYGHQDVAQLYYNGPPTRFRKGEGKSILWDNLLNQKNSESMKNIVGSVWVCRKRKAIPAQFRLKWAGLAVLFSRQLPNGSHDLVHIFSISTFLPSHF